MIRPLCWAPRAICATTAPGAGVSTNDGLGAAAQNIGRLLNVRNIYFVPFGQDDPVKKPRSLVADFNQIPRTIAAALSGVQMQPMLSYGAEGEAPTLH